MKPALLVVALVVGIGAGVGAIASTMNARECHDRWAARGVVARWDPVNACTVDVDGEWRPEPRRSVRLRQPGCE